MLPANAVFVAAAFNVVGSSTYIWATLKGRTRPNRVTWFLWALAPLIAFAAELGEGVGVRSLMTFMVGFSPACVLIASFVNRDAYWKLTSFDLGCGALSVVALVLWAATRTAEVAIVFSILADAVAALPTIVKAYREPETESAGVFVCGAISAAITLLTITNWRIADAAFPLYILGVGTLLTTLIRFPRLRLGPRRGAAAGTTPEGTTPAGTEPVSP